MQVYWWSCFCVLPTEVRWGWCLDSLRAVLIISRDNHIGLCCSRQTDDRLIRFPAQVVRRDFIYDGNLRASPKGRQGASSVIKGSKLCCSKENLWTVTMTHKQWRRNQVYAYTYTHETSCWKKCIWSSLAPMSPMLRLFYLLGKSFQYQ